MSQQTTAHPSPERIMQMAWGYAPPLVLMAAVDIGLFAALAEGPRTIEEIRLATGTSPRGLPILVQALAGLDLLRRDGDRYALAPDSAMFLVPSSPAYLGSFFSHVGGHLLPSWLKLGEAVRTGQPQRAVADDVDKASLFSSLVGALYTVNAAGARVLADHLASSLPSVQRILDVAAGSAAWSIPLAERAPAAEVTAVDLPAVIPTTRHFVTRAGLIDRYRFVAADAFEADFGQGYHVAVLGHILHSEGEARSRWLLRKVFDALAPGGTLAVAEWLVAPDRSGPLPSLMFAVNMLVLTESGTTWSFDEIAAWLTEIGFVEPRKVEAPGPGTLIVAHRPR
jgi:SAM-dependent methyltransferase